MMKDENGSVTESLTENGFTLVELLVTIAISSILMVAIVSAYATQQRLYTTQDQIAEMQQNLRAAMGMMTREIRMAGYDPTGDANAGLLASDEDGTALGTGRISFTSDKDEDGNTSGTREKIEFGFKSGADANRDGHPDSAADFSVWVDGAEQSIAENIQEVEFLYTDEDGTVTTDEREAERVMISLLARAGTESRGYTNNLTYQKGSGGSWGPYNDNYRRRLLVAQVKIRNIGM